MTQDKRLAFLCQQVSSERVRFRFSRGDSTHIDAHVRENWVPDVVAYRGFISFSAVRELLYPSDLRQGEAFLLSNLPVQTFRTVNEPLACTPSSHFHRFPLQVSPSEHTNSSRPLHTD